MKLKSNEAREGSILPVFLIHRNLLFLFIFFVLERSVGGIYLSAEGLSWKGKPLRGSGQIL